jgi:hypothetical protein
MPDLGDLGDLADKAKDLVGDHSSEIKDGIDKVADLVGGKVGADARKKVEDVAGTAKGLVDDVGETSKKSTKPKKKKST